MDDKVRRLLRVYAQMTEAQRTEFNNEIDKIRRGVLELRTLREGAVTKMDLGPMGGACAYCGR